MQGLLYRFLKTREVHSIGGGVTRRINARIISTSSRDLTSMVAEHSLREDLYYRLNVLHIRVRRCVNDVKTFRCSYNIS
jgi:transcriptional regulator with PAS, ATPase and Fis domain